MKSFGPLFRQLRGAVPLTTMAQQLGISKGHLANLEAGRRVPTTEQARQLLEHAFQLPPGEITRLLLDLQLRDYGLKDTALRRLVLDLVQQRLPAPVRRELRRLARSYAPGDGEVSLPSTQ